MSKLKQITWPGIISVRTVLTMRVTAGAEVLSQDQSAGLQRVPPKPKHAVGQLTTGELARERSRLEAALKRPFSEDVKVLLHKRLDAVVAEQDERSRKRQADTAAAKAALSAEAADLALSNARKADG